ncbi:hypothetical protein Cgig2_021364 [Carnegiea gigantea]|uniref:Cytochrome P450 n=1 Tax=Carnegiea gigantea TaxID=171969 RepID=A0A9Q1QHX7_9CARY|nr:hypothetical protein Cgig2_021364 [Carnegiea gigantea]
MRRSQTQSATAFPSPSPLARERLLAHKLSAALGPRPYAVASSRGKIEEIERESTNAAHHRKPALARSHQRFAELARVYGPLMLLRLGEVPTIIVSSADVAREVMRTRDAVLCSRPSIIAFEHVFYGCTEIAFAPYGEYWRQVRKIATLELFTVKRVQSFRPIREEEVANLVKPLAMEEGSVVNLSEKLFGLAFDFTSR